VAAVVVPAEAAAVPVIPEAAVLAVGLLVALVGMPTTCSMDCSNELNRPWVEVGLADEPVLLVSLMAACTPFLWPLPNILTMGDAADAAAVAIMDMMDPHW
jgi:hypothetical protein